MFILVIKVVIFYNHEMLESNILEFENEDEILDLSKINASDVIEIENGTNSEDNYQTKYSSANTLINKGDAGVNRELIVHYKGLMGNDNLLVGAQVYWYVPRNVTMLDINKNKLSEFTTDYERTARIKSNCNSYQGPGTSYTRKNSYTTDNIVKVYDLNQTLGYYSLKTSNSIGAAGEWIHQSYLELIDDNDVYKNGYSCFYKTIRSDGEED